MKLGDWLAWKDMTRDTFAALIEVSAASVSGYANGNHIPARATMQRIVEATEGAVQPQDFYQ